MRIDILKTQEINDNLWLKICQGFNECFDTSLEPDELKGGFCIETHTGFAYHALAFSDDNELMGYTVFTPTLYEGNLKVLVGGSTFIRQKYRDDFLLFAKIVNALKQRCAEDGYEVVVAVPNKNSIDYAIRINRFVYVADLDYYILPLALSKVINKPSLHVFDGVVRFLGKGWVLLNHAFSSIVNSKERLKRYRLVIDDEFYKARFQNKCYKRVTKQKVSFCYRHYDEEGKDVIYLMDFRENGIRTSKALCKALRYIIREEKADAILFVGFLDLKQFAMIKPPKRFVPKALPFTYHVIDKKNKELKDAMTSKNVWDFSLMNFDVR